ncbi:hypothetical protein P3S68_024829 [Capsicum galapagoense]
MDVGASSKMNERHWDLPDSQIPPDFHDAQVRELQASKANAPAKRERKKFRVLRSPYISKYGSGSKNSIDFDKEEKLKYAFDGYTVNQDLSNELMIDYSQWIAVGLLKTHSAKKETDNHYRLNASRLGYSQLDFVVAYPQSRNWFYLMSERKKCWNDEHLDVIFYHLRKKSKIQLGDNYIYTNTSCFLKSYVEKTHTRYYPAEPAVELSTQQDYVESIVVAKNEDSIANIIHGFCMSAGLSWYMVDETMAFMIRPTSDSLDCGIFVCAYAEILSEGLQVHLCGFDAASQRARYASLLWHYGVEKANEAYTSDNGDPPRPKKSVIEEIEASAIVTLE